MKLKRSEKWILCLSLLLLLSAAALCAFHGRQSEVFWIEENFTTLADDSEQNGEKININTASAQELEQLYGIGPALAQDIVDYRNENGAFRRIEDIAFVSGIGSEIFEAIKDHIRVD